MTNILNTLIVDDEAELRRSVISILKTAIPDVEFVVAEASTGREALDKVRGHNFDLVLMDVQMPVMDGLTATAEVLGRSKVYADDRNTDAAPAYWSANLRVGLEQQSARWKFSEFLRVDNITDRAYVGSVIVNASNAGFFEPAPGRTYYAMFTMSRRN